jgi:uncharacterized membrane protein
MGSAHAAQTPLQPVQDGNAVNDKIQFTASVHLEQQAQFASPFPPPAVLREYGDLVPSLPQTLLDEWMKETTFRREQESRRLDAEIKDRRAWRDEVRRGQQYGLGAVLSALVIAGIASIWSPTTGSVIGGTTIVALATAFITTRAATAGHPRKAVDADTEPITKTILEKYRPCRLGLRRLPCNRVRNLFPNVPHEPLPCRRIRRHIGPGLIQFIQQFRRARITPGEQPLQNVL